MAGNVADDMCCAEGRSTGGLVVEKRSNSHPFGKTMLCLRFLQILRYLHFVDNEGADTDKTLKTWKVQKLLDYLVKRDRDVYTPRRELSIDETMLKIKLRLSIKQYIKIKPVKWGIKLFTLAESTTGYVLDLLPYTGKRAETAMSKTAQTVLDVSRHFLNLGHDFFFDNCYMSIELLHALAAKNSLCCGTVNANRVGLPSDMKKTCAAVKKLKRGESLKRMSGDVLAVTWMDTRAVNLLCNIPGCLGDADVQRRDKRTGAEITISRPKAIELYNSFMGGVDLSDQRVATYRRHIKSLTWYNADLLPHVPTDCGTSVSAPQRTTSQLKDDAARLLSQTYRWTGWRSYLPGEMWPSF